VEREGREEKIKEGNGWEKMPLDTKR